MDIPADARDDERAIGPARKDDLAARLDAVEHAITGGDAAVTDLSDAATLESRLSTVESTVETLRARVDELDAATQAVRGYAGGISAVNEAVERRADLALATVERLERRLEPEPGLTVERLVDEEMDASDADMDPSETSGRTDGRSLDTEEDASDADGPDTGAHRGDSADDPARSLAARLRDAL